MLLNALCVVLMVVIVGYSCLFICFGWLFDVVVVWLNRDLFVC